MTYRLGETHLKAPAMHDSTLSSAQRRELQEGRGEHHLLARMCQYVLHTNSRHKDQRSATGCKEEKIDCLEFCLHSKWRKIKAHQCNTAHGRSTARAANLFTTTLLTCKLQGHQCWEELGLDFLPSINTGNVNCSIYWLTVQVPQTDLFLGIRSKQKIPLVPKNQDDIKRLGWCCFHVLLQINRGQPPLRVALSANYFSFPLSIQKSFFPEYEELSLPE